MARIDLAILVFGLLSFVLPSCTEDRRVPPPTAVAAGSAAPARGGTLVIASGEDVRTLDPAVAFDEVSSMVTGLLFDTLLDYAKTGSPDPTALVPSLASSWAISTDRRTYTFHIRERASFSNGEPVVADDFVYAIDRLIAPETAAPAAQFFRGITGAADRIAGRADHVSGLRAIDPRTLEVRLDAADPSFPLLLAMTAATPLKKSHVESTGARIGEVPLGTGPFVLASHRAGQVLKLARSPASWRAEGVYLDAITLRLAVPRDTMMLSFLRGELDLLDGLATDDVVFFTESPAWAPFVARTPLMRVSTEMLNTRRSPFTDRRVRQAFNYAINKMDSVRLANGRVIVANGFLPPLMRGHDPSRKPYPHDPDKARRLLAEAGYPNGFDITYTTLRDDLLQKIAHSIQADLAEVGVRMKVEVLTFPAYLNALTQGELTFAFSGWYMDFPDPWNFLEVKYHGRMIGGANATNETLYDNPDVNRLLDAARAEADIGARLALYRHAEDILFEDCPSVWHYFPAALDVRQPYVAGAARHPVRGLSLADAWLDNPTRRATP
jgi:peptide/nickel transport system substrate-binding protein/oligopeptide transport system substrate-binding protein